MTKEKKLSIISPLLIVLAAIIWGISFVAQSEGGDVGSFTFQAIRCTLAFLAIGAVALLKEKTSKTGIQKKKYAGIKEWISDNKTFIKASSICGVALGAGAVLQQFGIDMQGKETSTGKAGFLTALYIVLVPIFGVFLKKKIKPVAWFSVAVAVGGLYLIAVKPGSSFSISTADIILIAGAFGFGAQIITVDHFADKVDGIKLSCAQFFIAAIISIIGMLFFEKPDIHIILDNAIPLLYSGILSGGGAFTLQIIGQKRCNPVLASLLMSLESVFSAIADWAIRGNTLSSRELIGCVVMFAAIILAQSPEFVKKEKKDE